jgi:hypothetical protein
MKEKDMAPNTLVGEDTREGYVKYERFHYFLPSIMN